MVDAVNDPHRDSNDGIGGRRAQIVGGKSAQDLVCDPVRGVNRKLQCRGISHAGALKIGGLDLLPLGESLN